MAHFAKLSDSNTVLQVIVVANEELIDESGTESESKGVEFCRSLFGQDTIWKKTSYSGSFRKNFAGLGYTYDESRDAFIPPTPYASWVLDEETCGWQAPVPVPDATKNYKWDEESSCWIEITNLGGL